MAIARRNCRPANNVKLVLVTLLNHLEVCNPLLSSASLPESLFCCMAVVLWAVQLSLLPVVAHHRGTYFSYLHCWYLANMVWDKHVQHLLVAAAAAPEPDGISKQGGGGEDGLPLPAGVQEQLVESEAAAAAHAVAARQVFSLNRGFCDLELSVLLERWGSPLAASVVASKGGAVADVRSGLDLGCVGTWVWPGVND